MTKFNEINMIKTQTFDEAKKYEELTDFLNEPTFIPVIYKKMKDAIIYKSIDFAKTSKTAHLDAVKWFYQTFHFDYYQKYEKFNSWERAGLNRVKLAKWVSRKKF